MELFPKKLAYEKKGLLLKSARYWHTKDPCPVYDGTRWHIFGSGGRSNEQVWEILHATAPEAEGPWTEEEPAILENVSGEHVAAPGVIYDRREKIFHMFVQREFMRLGGTVEHLVSADGMYFSFRDTALSPIPDTDNAGIYDPHPALIQGQTYLTYSCMKRVSRPDICLTETPTNTWDGPWERRGTIVSHEHIIHHNQHDHSDYEWGLEGSQLIGLPSGNVLLNAVCFLPVGRRGERQRVFFAAAKSARGPYQTLGPVIEPYGEGWENGENGHAAGVIEGDRLYLFYQSRSFSPRNRWCYGLAVFFVDEIEEVVRNTLR